jgi:hypothetical protein
MFDRRHLEMGSPGVRVIFPHHNFGVAALRAAGRSPDEIAAAWPERTHTSRASSG